MNTSPSKAGPLIAIAVGGGAIIAFLIPGGIVFGVVLVLFCALYVLCLATGMNPHAGLGDTTAHLTRIISTARTAGHNLRTAPVSGLPPTMPPPMASDPAHPVATPPPSDPIGPVTTSAAPSPAPAAADVPATPADTPQVETAATVSAPAAPVPEVSLSKAALPPVPTNPPMWEDITGPPVTLPADAWTSPSSVPGRSRMPLIAVSLTAVVLLVVGVGGYVGWRVWESHRSTETTSALAPTMLHRSFPTVPSAAFAITPSQLGGQAFTRPNYSIGGEESTGFLQSSRYLITRVDEALVAIDPRDGRVAWRQNQFPGINCSDVFDDDTIGCTTSDGRLLLLSSATGAVTATLPGDYQRVKKFGGKYAYAKDDGTTATVSLGTRTNPTAYWTHTEPIPGGTRTHLDVSKKIVAFTDGSATGGWSLVYNESGQRVSQTTDSGTLIGDDEFTNTPGDSSLVFDSTGRMRYMTSSSPTQPTLYTPAPGISVAFTRDSAIDPSDGRVLWARPSTPSSSFETSARAVVGTVAVFSSADDGTTVGVDIPTGRVLWRSQFSVFTSDLTTDGRRLIAVSGEDGHEMYAVDVATGQRAWSVTMPDVGDYPKLVAVGDDLVVLGSQAVVGFHPTGGVAELYRGDAAQTRTPGSVTPCATPPTVTPENFAVDNQSLVVRLRFTAGCGSGDVLSNSGYQVTVRDQSSLIASSTFDLSINPVPVPADGGTVREFAFPAGTYYRLPSSLSGGSGSSTSVNAGGETVQCTSAGIDRVAVGQPYSSTATSDMTPLVGAVQAAQQGIDTTANAIDALRAQADADRPLVQSQYLDRWLAQISAKQVRTPPMMATDVDDRTMVAWTPEQILRQHLDLRARYPEVRLLYSDEWQTFDLRGWWITVAQPNVLDASGANAWCDSKAIAPNQCFAKLVSNSRGSAGTTAYRPGTTG